jgi:hypothetical protein
MSRAVMETRAFDADSLCFVDRPAPAQEEVEP